MYSTAESLFLKTWDAKKAVRLIGVGASGLEPRPRQLGLWDVGAEKERRLQATLEEVNARFGKESVRRGMSSKDAD